MNRKKILLLSVSAGSGHIRAAEALLSHVNAAEFPATVIHLDVMQFVTRGLRKIYCDFYIYLLKHAPAFWSYLYHVTNEARPDSRAHKVRRWAERLGSRPLLREIESFKPDHIICTHFLPAEILSHLTAAGRLHYPVWVQVTDFDLHRMWVHENIAGYFAPNEEVAFRMRNHGIPPGKIHVTGIPTMPVFSQKHDRQACARQLGINPQLMTLLLMGGGAGIGSLSAVAQRLLELPENFQLIVLAGKNAAELTALHELAAQHPGRLMPHGYTDKVDLLMGCSDLVITKPGGLTTSECLAMGLPMIVNAPIPGQEEHNANFLLEQGAALKALDLETLEYRILHLMAHPSKLQDMRTKAKALGRPEAANDVLHTVLGTAD